MRKNFAISAITLIFAVVAVIGIGLRKSIAVSERASDARVAQEERKPIRPDLPGTISGAVNPSAVPDYVAYELFLRTLASGVSRGLAEKIGLKDDEVDVLIRQARYLQNSLADLERKVDENRNAPARTANSGPQGLLLDLQKERERAVIETMSSFVLRSLDEPSSQKLQAYLSGEVKGHIKAVPATTVWNSSELGEKNRYYFIYADAWLSGATVYGTGSVTTSYTSLASNSYKVSTTIVSPKEQRFHVNSLADASTAVVSVTSLPIGVQDGQYVVEVIVESDKEGNGLFVGNVATSVFVEPQVYVSSITPSIREVCPNDSAGGAFEVTYIVTSGIPTTATVTVLLEFHRVTPRQNINYTVTPGGGTNANGLATIPLPAPASGTHEQTFTISTSGNQVANEIQIEFRGWLNSAYYFTTNSAGQQVRTDIPLGTRQTTNVTLKVRRSQAGVCGGSDGGGNMACTVSTGANCFLSSNGASCGQGLRPFPPCCCFWSPLIFDVTGNGFQFTDAAGGVRFDLVGDGVTSQVAWPTASSGNAWLALDRNGNGLIDNGKELFGNFTQQPLDPGIGNGFLALAEYDKSGNGGDGDNFISSSDSIFSTLRLWQDANHNGISEPNELLTLQSQGVTMIPLTYVETTLTDQYGNRFRYQSKAITTAGKRTMYDVYPVFTP